MVKYFYSSIETLKLPNVYDHNGVVEYDHLAIIDVPRMKSQKFPISKS